MNHRSAIGRRAFTLGALAGSSLPLIGCQSFGPHPVRPSGYPPLLDHLVWLAGDLDAACARFEALSGIVPLYGGRHPSGTHNALVALGPACYLEIAAPQPGVSQGHPWIAAARARPEPHLYAYCMRSVESLEVLAGRAQALGLRSFGPAAGDRILPDGQALRWRLFIPVVPGSQGVAPFFIDWLDSRHPASTAPGGAALVRFSINHPAPRSLDLQLAALAPGLSIEENGPPALVGEIETARGTVVVTS